MKNIETRTNNVNLNSNNNNNVMEREMKTLTINEEATSTLIETLENIIDLYTSTYISKINPNVKKVIGRDLQNLLDTTSIHYIAPSYFVYKGCAKQALPNGEANIKDFLFNKEIDTSSVFEEESLKPIELLERPISINVIYWNARYFGSLFPPEEIIPYEMTNSEYSYLVEEYANKKGITYEEAEAFLDADENELLRYQLWDEAELNAFYSILCNERRAETYYIERELLHNDTLPNRLVEVIAEMTLGKYLLPNNLACDGLYIRDLTAEDVEIFFRWEYDEDMKQYKAVYSFYLEVKDEEAFLKHLKALLKDTLDIVEDLIKEEEEMLATQGAFLILDPLNDLKGLLMSVFNFAPAAL